MGYKRELLADRETMAYNLGFGEIDGTGCINLMRDALCAMPIRGDLMKNVFVSNIRDEADEVFKLAQEFQMGIEILGFIEPYKTC